ncbi:hypothetical protein IJ670_04295 [bacterium]|nr:hypothetical protein [bacterium]
MDANLIAYEYYRNPYVKNDVYTSGEKEETNLINRYSYTDKDVALIVIEDDIVNSEGYGLKKGFYNVVADKYNDFLLLVQKGEIKAKVPVVKIEITPSLNQEKQEVKKMSPRAYQKYLQKQKKKYYKGIDPKTVDYKYATIDYDKENNCWVIIYETNMMIMTGIVKF